MADAKRPTCDCVAEMNGLLAERNTQITIELFTGAVVIATCKRDEKVRGRPLVAIASYCPFCGAAYARRPGFPNRSPSNVSEARPDAG